jgi:hypothetical protein
MSESCKTRNDLLANVIVEATNLPIVLINIVLEQSRCKWHKDKCKSFAGANAYGLCECHNPYTPKYFGGTCSYRHKHFSLPSSIIEDTGCCAVGYECGRETDGNKPLCEIHSNQHRYPIYGDICLCIEIKNNIRPEVVPLSFECVAQKI